MRWTNHWGAAIGLATAAWTAAVFAGEPCGKACESKPVVRVKKHTVWDCFRPGAPIEAEIIESVPVRRIVPETVRAEMVLSTESVRLRPAEATRALTDREAETLLRRLLAGAAPPESAPAAPASPPTESAAAAPESCTTPPAAVRPQVGRLPAPQDPRPTAIVRLPVAPTADVQRATSVGAEGTDDPAPPPPMESSAAELELRMNRLETKFDRLIEMIEGL